MNLFRDTLAWWPILFALPVVILTSTAGITITRIPPSQIPKWIRDYRAPVIPTLVSSAGILIVGAATNGGIPDLIRLGLPANAFARLGMPILGAGIGLAIVRDGTSRIIVATALGLSFAILYTWQTINHYHWIFVAVAMWWILNAMLHAFRGASPSINERVHGCSGWARE